MLIKYSLIENYKRKNKLRFIILSFSIIFCIFLVYSPIIYASELENTPQKILFLIPHGFNYIEYMETRNYLESWGYKIDTCSTMREIDSYDNLLFSLKVNYTIVEIDDIRNYHCVYVPGSDNWYHFGHNESVQQLLKSAYDNGLLISAICSSTYVLGCAGLIEGKNVTGYYLFQDSYESQGASYFDEPVVVDGRIITADIPYMEELSLAIHEYLQNNPNLPPLPSSNKISGYNIFFSLYSGTLIIINFFYIYYKNEYKSGFKLYVSKY